jgi:N-acetylglucosamine kinase-like BadF-type ATPase
MRFAPGAAWLWAWGMELFLGVDAGGTRTRAVVVDRAGAVRGVGAAGPGNWQALGRERASAEWRAAVLAALADAGGETDQISAAFFGLAGVRNESEREPLRELLRQLLPTGRIELAGDLEVAHAGALGGGPGVVVVAGTGSGAWGKNAAGETAQAGGWGWLVDDKGGGYWLALRGLSAAVEGEDGRGAATVLGRGAKVFFGKESLREVLADLHAGRRERAEVAAFAAEVRAAARAGDEVAGALVGSAVRELLRLAETLRRRLMRGETVDLAVVGGLDLGPAMAEAARAAGFFPVAAWGEPVLGAVLRAAELSGPGLDLEARTRLLGTWKPPV